MTTVLITTSGTGSRLGERTHYTNKSLVKVGDKYAISHIIDSYPASTEFIITLGHFGSHVEQFLMMAYPYHKLQFVTVDIFEGPGSSLGYSMLKAKEYLQKSFVFHCCDTLIKEHIELSDQNCLFVYKGTDYKNYSSIQVQEKKVLEMNSKGVERQDYLYIGISYIKDYISFWSALSSLYNENPTNTSLSDIHAIRKMIQESIPFTYKEVSHWFDTGNEYTLQKTQEAFKAQYSVLEKYDESLCFFDDRVIKFFSDTSVCQKRSQRGNLLYPLGPKILDSSPHFFCMEKIEGKPLGESNTYGDIRHLLNWTWDHLWSNQQRDTRFKTDCHQFYKKKTYERLQQIPFLKEEKYRINGLNVGPWNRLLEKVDFEMLATDTFTHYHGDFILDNIMKCPDGSFKLLDWRQDFNGNLTFGDMYYDLAKLRHNIYFNHKNVLEDLYTIRYNNDDEVFIDIKCNYMHIIQEKDIQEFAKEKNLNYQKIQLLTAIIWLNMAPLYEGKLREFLFYFGKFNLALALQASITIL